jgi:hypothetical protein
VPGRPLVVGGVLGRFGLNDREPSNHPTNVTVSRDDGSPSGATWPSLELR